MDMGGGAVPIYKLNDRVSFLLVKLSTVDFVNVWSPGYRWSIQ